MGTQSIQRNIRIKYGNIENNKNGEEKNYSMRPNLGEGSGQRIGMSELVYII